MRLVYFAYPNTAHATLDHRIAKVYLTEWHGSPTALPNPFLFRAIIEHDERIEGTRTGRLQMLQKRTGLRMEPPLRGDLPFVWDDKAGLSRARIEMELGGGTFFPQCGEYAIEVAVDEQLVGSAPIFVANSQVTRENVTVTLTRSGGNPGIENALDVVLAARSAENADVMLLVDPSMELYSPEPLRLGNMVTARHDVLGVTDETSEIPLKVGQPPVPFIHNCVLHSLELLRAETIGSYREYDVRFQRYGLLGPGAPKMAGPST